MPFEISVSPKIAISNTYIILKKLVTTGTIILKLYYYSYIYITYLLFFKEKI
jgi:hypothetical protein